MGGPTGYAKIQFPIRFIDDEIRDYLKENHNITLDPATGEAKCPYIDTEIETDLGIFSLEDSDRNDGNFYELEELLENKGVPYDRYTAMDWQIWEHESIFRPGMEKPLYIPQLEGEAVCTVEDIRAMLPAGAYAGDAIKQYLDERFPEYPPLSDFAGEKAA